MSDNYGVETRRRSRSKTPGMLAQENGDSGKKKSAIPIISLIEEEDDIIEISTNNARPKRQRRSKPAAESDSQSSPKESSSQKTSSQSSQKSTTKTVSNGNGDAADYGKSVTKTVTTTFSETTTTATDGANQSIFGNIFTAIKTSTPILSSKKSKRRTEISTKDINIAEHPAYKEYRDSGEYWNKFPKTDYTYSELSPHRRELSNGIVAMPNMSRKSLDNHANRVEVMIQQNPLDETFLRKKFLSTSTNTSYQRRTADLLYDSADEVDSLNEFRAQLRARRQRNPKYIVQAFYLSIVTFFSSIYNRARGLVVRSSQPVYTPVRRPYYQQKGIFTRAFESVQRFFLIGFSKVYLFISTVLCADTWLLYTRSEKTEENKKRRRFLLGLLALLPLLLFGGVYIYLDPPQEISLPKLTMPKLSLPSISLPQISLPAMPALPSVSLPKLPSLPSLSLPTISFDWLVWPSWLTFSLSWPAWLTFSLPAFSFSLPSFTLPELTLPTLSWPAWLTFSFSLPTLSWPAWLTFSVPSLSWPVWLTFSLPALSWPAWLTLPEFNFNFSWPTVSFDWLRLPEVSWPKISLPSLPSFELPSLPTFSWPKLPELSFSWLPEFSLPSFSLPSWFALPSISISLPSFSFDLSPITGFFYDIYDTVRTFFGDLIDKIIEIIMNFVTEVQVIWSENLNSVTNEKLATPAAPAPTAIPVSTPKVVKKVAEKVVKKVVEEVVNVVTAAPPVIEKVAKVAQQAN